MRESDKPSDAEITALSRSVLNLAVVHNLQRISGGVRAVCDRKPVGADGPVRQRHGRTQ